jgi:hypothetical protein
MIQGSLRTAIDNQLIHTAPLAAIMNSSFIQGSSWTMTTRSRRCTATRGHPRMLAVAPHVGVDGTPAAEAVLNGCFSCHEPAKARDFVFTRYAP